MDDLTNGLQEGHPWLDGQDVEERQIEMFISPSIGVQLYQEAAGEPEISS